MRAVNLLTPELRSSQKGSGTPRPSVMTTSGGVGAIALLGVLALLVAGERHSTLAEVSAKNDATVQRAAKLKPFDDFQTVAQTRAATVQGLASARFDWEQSLRDLSRALPKDVYLSSLTGSVGSGGGGGGGSGLRSSISAPAIELSGCTKNQPAVATLMSRLRNVQGVTRVSLSKSEKSDAEAAAGAGAAVNPCGKGAPPAFDIVVFFEKASIADALANATGDSTVGGTVAPAATPDATGKGTDDSSAKPESTPAATPGG
jgi:Tfp pilus assembly protein PilN